MLFREVEDGRVAALQLHFHVPPARAGVNVDRGVGRELDVVTGIGLQRALKDLRLVLHAGNDRAVPFGGEVHEGIIDDGAEAALVAHLGMDHRAKIQVFQDVAGIDIDVDAVDEAAYAGIAADAGRQQVGRDGKLPVVLCGSGEGQAGQQQ